MKLSREEVSERENYVAQLLRKDPKLSFRKLSAVLLTKFGKSMRFNRVQELRKLVLQGNHKAS